MRDTPKKPPTRDELDQLSRELAQRSGRKEDLVLRLTLWKFTVRLTYALKRVLDILLAGLALICLLPLMALIALTIKLTSRGPVFFVQVRVGRFGRHFRFYKFRSMYMDAEQRKNELLKRNESADGVIFKMKKDPRITPAGRILRKTSMDELPQLFNVLLGDMSLVGPRPPLPQEVMKYSLEDRKRLNVIPGLTCLWQISGRSDIPFNRQVELDKEYIHSRGIRKDLVILLKTVPAILTGRGAY